MGPGGECPSRQWRNQDFISEGSELWERAPPNPERAPKKPERPLQSKSEPLQSQSGPSKARAGPTKARAGPSKARAGPSKARAGLSKVRTGPSKGRAGPSKSQSGSLQIFRRGQLTPLTPPPGCATASRSPPPVSPDMKSVAQWQCHT